MIADCIGGSFWEENMKSIATDGRWVLYGLLGGSELDKQQLSLFMRKRITFMGTVLKPRSLEVRVRTTRQLIIKMVSLFYSAVNDEMVYLQSAVLFTINFILFSTKPSW